MPRCRSRRWRKFCPRWCLFQHLPKVQEDLHPRTKDSQAADLAAHEARAAKHPGMPERAEVSQPISASRRRIIVSMPIWGRGTSTARGGPSSLRSWPAAPRELLATYPERRARPLPPPERAPSGSVAWYSWAHQESALYAPSQRLAQNAPKSAWQSLLLHLVSAATWLGPSKGRTPCMSMMFASF